MIRLALHLDRDADAYRAAASRIVEVEIVDRASNADAIIASEPLDTGKPTLVVHAAPSLPNHFPAMPWRFSPHECEVKASIDSGQLGRPGLFRMHHWSPPGAESAAVARIAGVDLALWLIGEEPDSTHATRSPQNLLLHLGFPGGAMAMLDFSESLKEGEGYRSLTVVGSDGAAYADDHRDRNLLFAGGAPGATPPPSLHTALRPMLEDFVSAVEKGRPAESAIGDLAKASAIVRRAMS